MLTYKRNIVEMDVNEELEVRIGDLDVMIYSEGEEPDNPSVVVVKPSGRTQTIHTESDKFAATIQPGEVS